MRAVVQRVTSAEVEVEGAIVGRIGRGLLVYLGVGQGDDDAALEYVLEKTLTLRVFEHGGKLVGLFTVFGFMAAAVLSFAD